MLIKVLWAPVHRKAKKGIIRMVTIRPKNITTIHMQGACETHARSRVTSRDLTSVIDEPNARGGSNMGLTPTETLIASLIGCTNVIASRLAERMDIQLTQMNVSAEAEFDRRGAALEQEIEIPFPSIRLTISANSNATPEQIEQLAQELGQHCPVSKVLRAAGTNLEEIWQINDA